MYHVKSNQIRLLGLSLRPFYNFKMCVEVCVKLW